MAGIRNGLTIEMGVLLDPISVMMIVVVTFVSLMVHIYSLSYMKGEERFPAYYAFLGLFTFSMLGLVLSSNLFQIYIFWELVGVSSFLLIGFYYSKSSAVAAAKKAFIVTRFADLGFLIGILVLSNQAGTLDFQSLIARLTTPDRYWPALLEQRFWVCQRLAGDWHSCSWVVPEKVRCFPCISGCPMQWKVQPLFPH